MRQEHAPFRPHLRILQALLAEDTPEYGQGKVAILAEGQTDDHGNDDIVEAEAEDLARLGGKDRIEEDVAEGDVLAAAPKPAPPSWTARRSKPETTPASGGHATVCVS
jgi:hypothetical protein